MVVFVLDCASDSLRGELTKWMLETKPGVFVGNINALVRSKLWAKIADGNLRGGLMLYSNNTEQGFSIEMIGEPRREVVDLDGLQLIKVQ